MRGLNTMRNATLVLAAVVVLAAAPAAAKIDGVSGTTFDFFADDTDNIQAGDGYTMLFWGYGLAGEEPQYPGPTLIVDQGDRITINLTNNLDVSTSMVFPGQTGVTSAGGDADGLVAREADSGSSVSYSFIASEPGTYIYHSGTQPELQTEMGLVGVIIVRPVGFDPVSNKIAYNDPATAYDREYLFLMTEMDYRVHEKVELGQMATIDNTEWFPYYWFFNGRNAPDTMGAAFSEDLPHQPYNCQPRAHPGEVVLIRVANAGRDMHPFHHHGNHSILIARDGRLVGTDPGSGPDLATQYFTIPSWPGSTYDALWDPWTGQGLGWDVVPGETLPWEDPQYEGVPMPVELPDDSDLTFGQWFSGSPYLGSMGTLPPGNPGFNTYGGFAYMWHSHNEKELTNNDVYPGGMFTMMIVEPPGAPIDE